MNWYLQSGKDSDVVISTKIKFSRNLQGFKFNLKTKKEIEELKNKIKENVYAFGYDLKYLELKDMDEITIQSLVEKDLISEGFAQNKNGAILINDEENICIMINNEDHLEIQIFSSGLELENTLNYGIELDKKIEDVLGYATSQKYGYLTSLPTNCGTGLKVFVKVHLPALVLTNNVDKMFYAINNFGINIFDLNTNRNTKHGDTFGISNKRTLGITENDIIENIKIVTDKVIDEERKTRKLLADESIELEDTIYRSYGLLSNARKISLDETKILLSNIKMGTDLGILDELNDKKVQELYLYTQDKKIKKYIGKQIDKIDLDVNRAKVIKNIINEK